METTVGRSLGKSSQCLTFMDEHFSCFPVHTGSLWCIAVASSSIDRSVRFNKVYGTVNRNTHEQIQDPDLDKFDRFASENDRIYQQICSLQNTEDEISFRIKVRLNRPSTTNLLRATELACRG